MANIVTPTSVQLKAAKTQAFTVSVSWSIDPAGVGTIEGTGLYKVPEIIGQKQEVNAVAKDTDGKEIGRATITLLPPVAALHASTYTETHTISRSNPHPDSHTFSNSNAYADANSHADTTAVAAPVPPSAGTTAMIQPASATLGQGRRSNSGFPSPGRWSLPPHRARLMR